jgi:phosphoglycolate phosphatase-like HAD superfamily hydrolase
MSLQQYDKKKCFMIGDRDSDMLAANKAGICGKKYIGGNFLSFIKENI